MTTLRDLSRNSYTRCYSAQTLQRQFNRLLDEIADLPYGPAPHSPAPHSPAIEVSLTEDAVTLRAQLPGVKAEDLDIQVAPRAVAIAGQYMSSSQAAGLYSEFRNGRFRRVVNLPAAVEYDQGVASFQDGILTLTLPKAAAPQPQIHRVQLASPEAVPPEAATPAVADPQTPPTEGTEPEELW